MKYQGSCHCGDIRFDVEGVIDSATACNCSICERKGSLLWFVPRRTFHLQTPEENAASYTFNKHAIAHRFCKRCGTPLTRCPSKLTLPALGSTSPSTMRAMVLLPEPDSPTSPSVSPRSITNDTSSTTRTSSLRRPSRRG